MVSYTTLVVVAVVVWWLAIQHEQNAVTLAAAQRYADAHPLSPATAFGTIINAAGLGVAPGTIN